MSEDRRPITEGEMIGLFEFYLRKWCEEHEGEDTVVITNSDGKGTRRRGHRSNNQQRRQEDIRGDAVRQGG